MDKYQELIKNWLLKLRWLVLGIYLLGGIILFAEHKLIIKHQELSDHYPIKLQAVSALNTDLLQLQQLLNASKPPLDPIQRYLAEHWYAHRKHLLVLDDELQSSWSLSQFAKNYSRLARRLGDPNTTLSASQLDELSRLINSYLSQQELSVQLDNNAKNNKLLLETSAQTIRIAMMALLLAITFGAYYLWSKLKKVGRVSDRNRQLALYARRNSKLLLRLTQEGKLTYYNDKVYQLGQRYGISRYDLLPDDIKEKIKRLIKEHYQHGLKFELTVDHCHFSCHLDWVKEIDQVYMSLELLNVDEADQGFIALQQG